MRRIVTTDKNGKKKLVNVPSFDDIYVNCQMGQPAYDVSISSNGSGSAEQTTSNLIYDSLSAAGQSAFNAASVGDFFSVSAADYASVFSNVTGTTKYAMTDAQLAETNDGWAPDYAYTIDQAASQIPISSYVIGFAARSTGAASAGTITPLISTTYRGSYSAISNSPSFAAGNPSPIQYYIRKNPTTGTAATSYLALVASITRLRGTSTYGGAFAQSPYSTWTNYPTAPGPVQQFLSTTVKSWT